MWVRDWGPENGLRNWGTSKISPLRLNLSTDAGTAVSCEQAYKRTSTCGTSRSLYMTLLHAFLAVDDDASIISCKNYLMPGYYS